MRTKPIKRIVLLVLAAITLNVAAGYAQTPTQEAIEKWQHLSESEKQALRQRFQRWESLSDAQKLKHSRPCRPTNSSAFAKISPVFKSSLPNSGRSFVRSLNVGRTCRLRKKRKFGRSIKNIKTSRRPRGR
jgi:hypothetical protein